MKKMVKTLSIISILGLSVGLVGCDFGSSKVGEAETVMNVSLNPEVEFILDEDSKVISVNASNEEGNLVISSSEFEDIEGLDVEQAVEIFISVSTELGFIVEGNVRLGDNEIEISVSGDSTKAQEIFDSVEEHVNEYFSKENIEANIKKVEDITRAELEALLLECEPYFEEAEVKAMEYKEILNALAESRKETIKMYSQELKKAYYDEKAHALECAEIEVLRSNLNSAGQLVLEGLTATYQTLIEELEQTRYDLLIKEDSLYQIALADFNAKKTEYLNYRSYIASLPEADVTEDQLARLEALDQLVEAAEAQFESALETAHALIDKVKESLKLAYDKIIESLEKFNVHVNDHLDKLEEAKKNAVNDFTQSFEQKHSETQQKSKEKLDEIRDGLGKGKHKEE